MNTWPGGFRHPMTQAEHRAWNAHNSPGTLQMCTRCGEPTGRCEEDTMWSDMGEALCSDCYHATEIPPRQEPVPQ